MNEINITELRRTIMKRMMRHRSHPDFEDGLQEAYIRSWEDLQAGMDDYGYLVRRAAMWGRAYLYNSHHYATGDLGRDRTGMKRAAGEASREKIKNYIREYVELHGNTPTNVHVAEALGMSDSNVGIHLKILREQSFKVITREEDGNRVDRGAYKYINISDLFTNVDDSEREDNENHKALAVESFENEYLAEQGFLDLIEPLDDELKTIVILLHCYDWSQKEVGEYLGFTTNPQPRVKKKADRAYRILRGGLNNDSSTG